MTILLIDAIPGETRIARLDGDRLVSLIIDRPEDRGQVGAIHLGRVVRIDKGLEAAFVDIGRPRPGFLGLNDARPAGATGDGRGERIADHLGVGDAVLVQVTRDALEDKGPRLSARPNLQGRRLVSTPLEPGLRLSKRLTGTRERERLRELAERLLDGDGLIVRGAADGADEGDLVAELRALRAAWAAVREAAGRQRAPCLLRAAPDALETALLERGGPDRILVDDAPTLERAAALCRRLAPDLAGRLERHRGRAALFEAHGAEASVEAALSPRVDLPSGAWLMIQQTAALCAIDVNTGSAPTAGKSGLAHGVNLAAADEIARQIALRNIGGALVVDFAPNRNRTQMAAVADRLRRASADDPRTVHVLGPGPLGMIEMTRERRGRSLAELLLADPAGGPKAPLTAAFDAARALLALAGAPPAGRVVLGLPTAVARACEGPAREALDLARQRLGRPLALEVRDDLPPGRFEIAERREG